MRRSEFERIVQLALDELPDVFHDALDNLDIQVRWAPTPYERRAARLHPGSDLFGLYTGIPLPQRSHSYGMAFHLPMPDTILIFQRAHERHCRTEEEMVGQARQTVLHEIGHYMGIDEHRLRDLGVG
jgi:predicted Zn-dependent protease with MMP-like domain